MRHRRRSLSRVCWLSDRDEWRAHSDWNRRWCRKEALGLRYRMAIEELRSSRAVIAMMGRVNCEAAVLR
jgi:hypothetical protein